jgi:hypothetical protein
MYLLAPISLVILNPIGFVILEVGRANNWDNNNEVATSPSSPENIQRRSRFRILLQVQI